MSRSEAKSLAEKMVQSILGSVSKKLDILLWEIQSRLKKNRKS